MQDADVAAQKKEAPTDKELATEIGRRRTFAIISHPDAGKTTMTEKLLLYGGAVQEVLIQHSRVLPLRIALLGIDLAVAHHTLPSLAHPPTVTSTGKAELFRCTRA